MATNGQTIIIISLTEGTYQSINTDISWLRYENEQKKWLKGDCSQGAAFGTIDFCGAAQAPATLFSYDQAPGVYR